MMVSGKNFLQEKAGWIKATGFALVLNGALFSFMPGLITRTSDYGREHLQPLHTVNFIRIKKPEPPVRKKEFKKPEPVKKPKETRVDKTVFQPKQTTRLKLPFEINPRLPSAQGIIPTLFMEKYSLHVPEVYHMDDIDHPITPLVQVKPFYPFRAKRLGIEGWVKVKMLVNKEGKVEKAEIVDAQPKGVFEKSVLQCVYSYRFSPGTVDGVPVNTWVTEKVSFECKNEE